MKYWMLLCCFFAQLAACPMEERIDLSDGSVLEMVGEKIYLNPDRIEYNEGRFFLLNDIAEWSPLSKLGRDKRGFYAHASEPVCPNGHVAFRRVGRIWYCFNEYCPYFWANT